jgi:hypothetical protein
MATVQILALEGESTDWALAWTGSGTVVSNEGLNLRNAYVLDNRAQDAAALGAALTVHTDRPA